MQPEHTLHEFLESRGFARLELSRNRVGQFELPATIDGRAARLILDTGASGTVMDAASAKSRGLPQDTQSVSTGGAAHAAPTCRLELLEIGPLHFVGVEALVADLGQLNEVLRERGHEPVDGVMGADLLQGREALMDFAGSSLYLKADAREE